ncbi:MAG: phosphotransferase, partial [Candidatus Sumerlaeia bacterium]|nr:phosphotransferase [Candidatus Sumerlaeia bacterium]
LGREVYNTGCDVEINRGIAEVQWNDLLSRGKKLFGFAVDDCHRIYYDTFQGWIWVKAPKLTQSAILEAIKQGQFYST